MSERGPYRRGGSPCPPSLHNGWLGGKPTGHPQEVPLRPAGLASTKMGGKPTGHPQEVPLRWAGLASTEMGGIPAGHPQEVPLRYGPVDNRMTLWPAYLLLPAEVARYPAISGGV